MSWPLGILSKIRAQTLNADMASLSCAGLF